MESLDLIFAIVNLALGILLVALRPRFAREREEAVARGEMTAEVSGKRAKVIYFVGPFLIVAGILMISYQLFA